MSRNWRWVFGAFVVAGLCAGAAGAQTRKIETYENADFFGFDLRAEKDVSLDQCKAICLEDSQCRAFTYNISAQWCFLKSDHATRAPFDGAVAGKVVTVDDQPDLGAPPALGFLSDGLLAEARDMRRNIAARPVNSGLAALTDAGRAALAAGSYQFAADNFRAALSLAPGDVDLWLELAQANLGWLGADQANNYQVQRDATGAALNGYEMSRNPAARAQSLDLLAKALEWRQLYRAALQSYKESLALVDSPRVLADFRDLRARKGFRVVEHSVDADSNTARICVRFSDPLVKSGVDYRTFVTVDGQTIADVTAQGDQLCAEDLEHGRTYRLSLRSGLPAAIGEVLESPVTINAYIRDRSPTVRFTGNNFVLPGSARRGIPIVSVNTSVVEVELFRIGDRSLASLLSESQFLRQLDGYDAVRIRNDLGELVWQGMLDVQSDLNRETTTSFPIDEAVPERKPGVYVMLARAEGERPDNWTQRATQWLVVSDIGLSTFSGTDGLNVFARSLETAKPMTDVTLTLLARNNEVLARATSDADGRVNFAPGLVRGKAGLAPAVVTADTGDGDFVFLDMTRAGFDLSDRGVTGRAAPGPIDIFAWTERGIYRAGETVHLAALARNDEASAVSRLPLTFIVQRPDGKEERRVVRNGGPQGGYALDLDLPRNAMHGAWTVRIHTDPKQAALVESRFLVEDFRPDRIEFDLIVPKEPIVAGQVEKVGVDGRFLYGAPAAGLALEADLRLKTVRQRDGHAGYVFGLADEEESADQVPIANLPRLDADGKAVIDVDVGSVPSTTRPLVADLTVRMREGGGRAVERSATIPVLPVGPMIGIKPEFEDGLVGENSIAAFRVITVEPNGAQQDMRGLKWSLMRIERDYQWYREGNSWRFEPVEYTRQIDDGTIDNRADSATEISVAVDWGRYRLEIDTGDAAGPATSIEFDAGWYVSTASTETPDGLEIALDRQTYRVGDVAKLQISPRFSGEVLVTIADEKLHDVITATVPTDGAVLDIPVDESWGAGAYVTATLIRPGDASESRMPSRSVGIKWLAINPEQRSLDVQLDLPERIRPNSTLDIPVAVSGSAIAEGAHIVVAAVDVGILNLTRYEPPNPVNWYFGQRRMGVELRDLYGQLIDGSQGVSGAIRTGGDGPGLAIKGSPPKEKLVALYSGIVQLDSDGQARIALDIPQFNGTLRVMSVAWTKDGVGNAVQDVIVRDPVVITSSLPQFLAPDDVSQLRIDIANTDGPAGEYTITMVTDGALSLDAADIPASVNLAEGGTTALVAGLKANSPGESDIVLRLTGPDGTVIERSQALTVRPASLPVARRIELPLASNGGSAVIDGELLAASYLDGASVSVSVTRSRFDVPALLMSLDRYPYGCAEQTTSRALPLLYVNEFEAPPALLEDKGLKERVQAAIERVLAYQSAAGSFGLWGPGGGDLWLDAYVTDFLTRAREKDYAVPSQAMRLALDNLQSVLSYTTDISSDGDAIAYGLYVLARNKRAAAGDLRYYAESQLQAFDTPIARAQLAAALALYGDSERAQRVFASAYRLAQSGQPSAGWRGGYGSALRDDAAMLALAGESRPVTPLLGDMVRLVSDRQALTPARSTQEQAWMLLAARATGEADADLSLRVNGTAHRGGLSRRVPGRELLTEPIRVENDGALPVTAIVTAIAAPVEPPRAGGDGFTISRRYYDMQGKEISIESVAQNERFVAVLTIEQTNDLPAQVIVTDLLPAGLEIDNPKLVESANLNGFDWLGETTPAHVEFRSDRFVAAFQARANNRDRFTTAYVVRAVVPGVYTHPAAQVEDMYRPRFAARTATRWMEVKAAQP
ncbi:MAG: alpha-2-macroglobulin family protein [Alphaproteobacteria bacterium]|nr:alpha-2-macroglobulin family protein [Alphaproteobacteria bacterium]